MYLSSLTSDRMPLIEDYTHELFSADDFLDDEPIRKKQSTMSRSSGPLRMGRRIEDIPDPRSIGPQIEPDEEESDEEDEVQSSNMPDYGMNDEEEYQEYDDYDYKYEQAFDREIERDQSVGRNALATSQPEPEDELVGTNKPKRPGIDFWNKDYDPERNWKSHRRQRYVGESVDRIAPVIKKDGVYVFDKNNDRPTLVRVLEVKGNQAKIQLVEAFRTNPRNGNYWVSTRDLKPDRI